MDNSYKLDHSFGPIISKTGIIWIFIGTFTIKYSYWGIALLAIGMLLTFTFNYTEVNAQNMQIKNGTKYFGFLKFGKSISIKPEMTLKIRLISDNWQMNSLSNRSITTHSQNYYVILVDKESEEICRLAMAKTKDQSEIILEQICKQLKLKKNHN